MNKWKKVLGTITSLLHYPRITRKLNNTESNIFFVFPSWQIGGSERVHIDILGTVKNSIPICFITEIQEKKGLKEEFNNVANVIYLRRWAEKKNFKTTILKKIAATINKKPNAVVFGSNNFFIYDLIPYLAPDVKIIDLTHSFSIDLQGFENYSLNHVNRIQQRIILGSNALKTFESIYQNNDIPSSLIQRFKIIPNKVSIPITFSKKVTNEPLEILFVSRNSKEKRPDLFFRIVDACIASNVNVRFTIIGDFEKDYSSYSDKVNLAGEIYDKKTLNDYYKSAHLILITSIFEGFPMVLLESMAYGVVPISTDVGEIPHFISEDKQTGFLIDNTLPDQEKIQKFKKIIDELSQSEEKMQVFSKKSYELVNDNFSEERFNDTYKDIFNLK